MPPIPDPEQDLLTWTAPSRPHQPLDKQVASVGLIIAILVSIIFAFAGDWMTIVVIAAICFSYYVWSTYVPENTSYSITTWGVRSQGHLYRWEVLLRWWIEPKGRQRVLMFDTPAERFQRLYLVLSPEITPDQLKSVIGKYLPEEKPDPTPMDRATSWLARTFPLTK